MKTFLLTLTTASILLLSGCAMVPNTVLLGEHGCPKLELNEQNKVKTDLSAEFRFGMTEEDVRNIMKSEPIAYLPKNEQDVSWLRWYYSRETIKGQQWKCLSICADFKFVNGKLVGYAAGDGPKGDCNWSPEIRWTLFKITQPILTRHIDQKINRQMYFNDEMLSNEITSRTWATYFFTKNIFIIGFGMDYSEIDIWWLIIYRASIIINKKAKINNKIYFYYCYEENSKNSSFMDCLRSMQIEVLERKITQTNNWEDTYIKMAEDIKRKILIK